MGFSGGAKGNRTPDLFHAIYLWAVRRRSPKTMSMWTLWRRSPVLPRRSRPVDGTNQCQRQTPHRLRAHQDRSALQTRPTPPRRRRRIARHHPRPQRRRPRRAPHRRHQPTHRQIPHRRTIATTPRHRRGHRTRSDVDPHALPRSPTGRGGRTVLERHRLRQRHHPHLACTQTNTDGSVTIGNTKTPGNIRTLEAPHVVLDALEHHRQRQDEHAATLGPAWSNPRQPGVHLPQRTTRRPQSGPQRIRPPHRHCASRGDGPRTCYATPPPA